MSAQSTRLTDYHWVRDDTEADLVGTDWHVIPARGSVPAHLRPDGTPVLLDHEVTDLEERAAILEERTALLERQVAAQAQDLAALRALLERTQRQDGQ